jgi:heme/copper-type cytochrome/quinol oxidase subunit 2
MLAFSRAARGHKEHKDHEGHKEGKKYFVSCFVIFVVFVLFVFVLVGVRKDRGQKSEDEWHFAIRPLRITLSRDGPPRL